MTSKSSEHNALRTDQIECRILNVEVKMHDPDMQINSFVIYFDIRHLSETISTETSPFHCRRFTADFPIHLNNEEDRYPQKSPVITEDIMHDEKYQKNS